MYYDFERKIVKNKHILIAFGLYVQIDYPDILENQYEFFFVGMT